MISLSQLDFQKLNRYISEALNVTNVLRVRIFNDEIKKLASDEI
jgi:hypothetical protein